MGKPGVFIQLKFGCSIIKTKLSRLLLISFLATKLVIYLFVWMKRGSAAGGSRSNWSAPKGKEWSCANEQAPQSGSWSGSRHNLLAANLFSKFDDSLSAELHKCLGFLLSFFQLRWLFSYFRIERAYMVWRTFSFTDLETETWRC